jgi:hypothetical protein
VGDRSNSKAQGTLSGPLGAPPAELPHVPRGRVAPRIERLPGRDLRDPVLPLIRESVHLRFGNRPGRAGHQSEVPRRIGLDMTAYGRRTDKPHTDRPDQPDQARGAAGFARAIRRRQTAAAEPNGRRAVARVEDDRSPASRRVHGRHERRPRSPQPPTCWPTGPEAQLQRQGRPPARSRSRTRFGQFPFEQR